MKFFRYLWKTVLDSKIPVWLTLVLFSAGAGGAYFLSPRLDEAFERNRIRSEYLISNINGLNTKIVGLFASVGELNRNLIEGATPNPRLQANITQQIIALQWKAIEFDVIFGSDRHESTIRSYRATLGQLQRSVEQARTTGDVESILCTGRRFVVAANDVLHLLAQQARLNLSSDPGAILDPVIECPGNR